MGAGWGDGGLVKAAPECVIEFFPFPSSVWAGMCVWPSVVGGDTELSVWKDAVSPFCLPDDAAVRRYEEPLQRFSLFFPPRVSASALPLQEPCQGQDNSASWREK